MVVNFTTQIRQASKDGSYILTVPKQYLKDGSLAIKQDVQVTIVKKEGDLNEKTTGESS